MKKIIVLGNASVSFLAMALGMGVSADSDLPVLIDAPEHCESLYFSDRNLFLKDQACLKALEVEIHNKALTQRDQARRDALDGEPAQ